MMTRTTNRICCCLLAAVAQEALSNGRLTSPYRLTALVRCSVPGDLFSVPTVSASTSDMAMASGANKSIPRGRRMASR